MSTRVIRAGRTVFRSYAPGESRRRPPVQELSEDMVERQQDALGTLPVPAGRTSSIGDRAGKAAPKPLPTVRPDSDLPWYCAQDRVTYRPVSPILTEHGWGTLGFWMRRWSLPAEDVLRLVRNRLLDAATEPGGAVKWYRVLDERAVLDVIKTMRTAKVRAASKAKKPAKEK